MKCRANHLLNVVGQLEDGDILVPVFTGVVGSEAQIVGKLTCAPNVHREIGVIANAEQALVEDV